MAFASLGALKPPGPAAALAAPNPAAASPERCGGIAGRWPSSGRTSRGSSTSRSLSRAM